MLAMLGGATIDQIALMSCGGTDVTASMANNTMAHIYTYTYIHTYKYLYIYVICVYIHISAMTSEISGAVPREPPSAIDGGRLLKATQGVSQSFVR